MTAKTTSSESSQLVKPLAANEASTVRISPKEANAIREKLAKLAPRTSKPEEEIDLSDAPEMTEEQLVAARQSAHRRKVAKAS